MVLEMNLMRTIATRLLVRKLRESMLFKEGPREEYSNHTSGTR